MIDNSRDIRRAQKESLILKEFSNLYLEASLDNPILQEVFINRVQLSPDKGTCTVYFYTAKGYEAFKEILKTLILYKPSLRAALGSRIKSRYVPNLVFKFDEQFEKQERLESLLNKIKDDGDQ